MNKLELLQEELRNYGKVAIAYSGGVDSNFLFHVALETLGKENIYYFTQKNIVYISSL